VTSQANNSQNLFHFPFSHKQITYFDAFPLFSTESISFFSSNWWLMMDGQFSSIARRKFDETANGAATGTEKLFLLKAVRAPEPS
jgi:hypothetical protein